MNQFEYKNYKAAIAVDFDSTITEHDDHPDMASPRLGAKEFMEELRRKNFKIIIFTGRLNSAFSPDKRTRNYMKKKIAAYLNKNNIPFDEIAEPKDGKPRMLACLDDRAIGFRGSFNGIIEEIEKMYEEKVIAVRNPAIDQWLKIMKNPTKRKKYIEKLERELDGR